MCMKYLIGLVSVIGIVLMPIVADAAITPFAYLEGSGGQMSYSLDASVCTSASIDLFSVYPTLPLDFTGAYSDIYTASVTTGGGQQVMLPHLGHYLLRATCNDGGTYDGVVYQIPYIWDHNTDQIAYSINGTNLRIYSEHGSDIGGECTYYDTSMSPQETIGSSPTFCEFDLTGGVITLPAYFGVDNTTLGNVYVPAIIPDVGSSSTTPLYTHGDFTQPELLAGIFLAVLCMFLVMWSFRKS